MPNQQLIERGIVIAFVDGQPDLVRLSDGFHVTSVYIPGDSGAVSVGKMYNVYKQNSTYMLGTEIQGR